MAENTVKVDVSFRSLLDAVFALEISEKRELWQPQIKKVRWEINAPCRIRDLRDLYG